MVTVLAICHALRACCGICSEEGEGAGRGRAQDGKSARTAYIGEEESNRDRRLIEAEGCALCGSRRVRYEAARKSSDCPRMGEIRYGIGKKGFNREDHCMRTAVRKTLP